MGHENEKAERRPVSRVMSGAGTWKTTPFRHLSLTRVATSL